MDYEAENIKKSIVSLFEEFTESDDISEDWPRIKSYLLSHRRKI